MFNFLKIIILVGAICVIFSSLSYSQETQEFIEKLSDVYSSSEPLGQDVSSGFSVSVIVAGILFGCIGFVAFAYGKKTSNYRQMLIGFLLMVLPYIIKNVFVMYGVGIALCIGLFLWRE